VQHWFLSGFTPTIGLLVTITAWMDAFEKAASQLLRNPA
jgi:hypothetical protein